MNTIRHERKILLSVTALLLLSLAAFITSCGEPSRTGDAGGGAGLGETNLDSSLSVEQTITAQQGGRIEIELPDGSRATLAFAPAALDKDTTFVVTPYREAPSGKDEALAPGIQIVEKGKEGSSDSLQLAFPVFLNFNFAGDVPPEEAIVVKYLPDGSYEDMPSEVTSNEGQTMVSGQLMSLSAYGPRKSTPKRKKAAWDKYMQQYTWHILVNDNVTTQCGDAPCNIFINADLTNVSGAGRVEGTYSGKGYMREQISSGGYTWDAKLEANFLLEVLGSGKIGDPNYAGVGRATFTGGGVVSGPGGAIGEREEPWPIDVNVKGALVTLKLAAVNETFRGTIRGQGNRPGM